MSVKTFLMVLAPALACVGYAGSGQAQATKEQSALVLENFQSADADKSGSLSRKEFEVFMRANAKDGIGSAKQVVQMNAFDRAFEKLDANSDGQITLAEFKAGSSGSSANGGAKPPADSKPAPGGAKPPINPKAAQALRNFQAADTDNSGGLDLEEFRAFLRLQATTGDVPRRMLRRGPSRRMFRRIDRNNDGVVTLKEFQASQKDRKD